MGTKDGAVGILAAIRSSRITLYALAMSALGLIHGCGESGAAVRSQTEVKARILVLGDSTSAGSERVNPAAFAEHELPQVRYIVHARGGATLWHLLSGTAGATKLDDELRDLPPDVVAVQLDFGINDTQSYSAANFFTLLTATIGKIEARGLSVILSVPNPVDDKARPELAGLAQRADIMRYIASRNLRVILCDPYPYFKSKMTAYERQRVERLFADITDGVHPDTTLVRVEGKVLANCARMVLARG